MGSWSSSASTSLNTGRAAAIITDIAVRVDDDRYMSALFALRGSRGKVDFPVLPIALAPNTAMQASFPPASDSIDLRGLSFRVKYLRPARFGRPGKPKVLLVASPAKP